MKKIVYWVIGIHCALLVALVIDHLVHRRPLIRPIAVRTVRMRPPPSIAQAPKSASAKPSIAKKKESPLPSKPVASKKPAQKVSKPTPLPSFDPPSPPPRPSRTEIQLPSLLEEKAVVSPSLRDEGSFPSTYEETLISFLTASLELPEYGEVRAELTLTREGRLLSIDILDAKSRKNKEFLKKKLPELLYPCFNDSSSEIKSFTVVFRNEDSFSIAPPPSPVW